MSSGEYQIKLGVRLPLAGLTVQGCRSENGSKKELWPGVACGGAAIQCIHCGESTGRQVIQSISLMWQHLGLMACYHFPQCKKIPSEIRFNLQTMVPSFNSINFQTFQTELGLLSQHITESLHRHTEIHVPLVQTHPSFIRIRSRKRSRSRSTDRPEGSKGIKVSNLERLVHKQNPNGKVCVTAVLPLENKTRQESQDQW